MGSPASIDWQPVSAIAGWVTREEEDLSVLYSMPMSETSEGTAWMLTLMNGCGSEARRSHILQRSL